MAPRRKKARSVGRVPLSAAAAGAGIPVVNVKAGEALTVLVDVDNISVPYSVVFDERTLMYSLVDRKEATQPLPVGTYRLSWSFSHVEKDWKHEVSVETPGGGVQGLDSRSEAKKDSPYTIGLALVVAS